jgi:hypothetical protein
VSIASWLYVSITSCLFVYSGVHHVLTIWVTWRVSYKMAETTYPSRAHEFTRCALVGCLLFIFFVFWVVLLCVFTFWVPCCDVCYDFRIKTIFGSFLPPVFCRRDGSCLIYVRLTHPSIVFYVSKILLNLCSSEYTWHNKPERITKRRSKWTIQRNWQHRWRKAKQKHNTICVEHHYTQINTNNVNT